MPRSAPQALLHLLDLRLRLGSRLHALHARPAVVPEGGSVRWCYNEGSTPPRNGSPRERTAMAWRRPLFGWKEGVRKVVHAHGAWVGEKGPLPAFGRGALAREAEIPLLPSTTGLWDRTSVSVVDSLDRLLRAGRLRGDAVAAPALVARRRRVLGAAQQQTRVLRAGGVREQGA